jgi:uncharacterized protein
MATQTSRILSLDSLRLALLCLALLGAGGCGGGGSGDGPAPIQGSIESRAVVSRISGKTYPLRVYLPPASAGSRAALPIVYALDGDWWFTQLVDIAETTKTHVVVVGIGNNADRAIDYVPPNGCTAGGGGHVTFLAFIRNELIPYIEGTVGGNPARRALLGHSHGGSFVYYAMFADAPGAHPFSAYLASDASISCMSAAADAWESAYATSFSELPVRLHISHTPANNFDIALAQRIRDRRYARLVASEQTYSGTHTGIIPAAFTDALAFAFAP